MRALTLFLLLVAAPRDHKPKYRALDKMLRHFAAEAQKA
jgi:hypothetical protein